MRRDGWLVAVPLTPVVLIALILTFSVYGAIFGVPLLLLVARPWWSSLSVGLGRRTTAELTRGAVVHIVVCTAVGGVGFVTAGLYGLDDLQGAADTAYWLGMGAMLLAATVGTVGIVRARFRADPQT